MIVAVTSSVTLVKFLPQYSARQSYFLTALSVLLLEFIVWAFYAVILYPKFLSPIRHLPGPKPDSFFNGSFKTIRELPTGVPGKMWMKTVPNDGLIRYMFFRNKERIMLTNPKALAEVLTTKSYTFVKPDYIRFSLTRLLGDGLLISEGDVHKVSRISDLSFSTN